MSNISVLNMRSFQRFIQSEFNDIIVIRMSNPNKLLLFPEIKCIVKDDSSGESWN
jgi:hypothetical protein